MILNNLKHIYLMTYESILQKKGSNEVITFVAIAYQDVSISDVIHAGSKENPSKYKINKITAQRPAALSNHTHYTAEATWSR